MEKTRIPLYFDGAGNFRVLMTSDLQEKPEYDPRSEAGLRAMIAEAKPDLVIWGGDNIDGRKAKTAEELRAYLDVFARPMEDAGIPWMHVYGNHDYDMDIHPAGQNEIYRSYPHCISGVSPAGVPGVSNYAVPILDRDTGKAGFMIYAFDTMHKENPLREGIAFEDMLLPQRPTQMRKWEALRFEQLMWYWNASCEAERENGGKVRAMAVMHVPPHEFQLAVENPEACSLIGECDEKLQSGILNCGIFAAMLQRGDVDIIASGHLHRDTMDAVYAGVRMCLDGCAGVSVKSMDDRRGGRVFDIKKDGTHSTFLLSLQKLGVI